MNVTQNFIATRKNNIPLNRILRPDLRIPLTSSLNTQPPSMPSPQYYSSNAGSLQVLPNQVNNKQHYVFELAKLKENVPLKVKKHNFIITNGFNCFEIPKNFIIMKKFNKLLIFTPEQKRLSKQDYNELMLTIVPDKITKNKEHTKKHNHYLEELNPDFPRMAFTPEQMHSMEILDLRDYEIGKIYKTEADAAVTIYKTKLSMLIPKNYSFMMNPNSDLSIYNEQNKPITELELYSYMVKTYQLYDIDALRKPVQQVEPYKEFNVANYVANENQEGKIELKDNSYYVLEQENKDKITYWRHVKKDNSEQVIPWKIHIYIDDISLNTDWNNITSCILPYLCDRKDIKFKMLKDQKHYRILKNLNKNQKGKAIVIYPRSKAQFEEIAKHISQIIQNNNLQIKDSNIIGDRQLGSTGRIFYRYSDITGQTYHLDQNNNETLLFSHFSYFYEPNRGNDRYLPDDMTQEDDIFFDFNPDIV